MFLKDFECQIIHDDKRIDREDCIGNIRKSLRKTKIFRAICPIWETKRDSRAIRGCSLSHLEIIKKSKGPVLVLEDDVTVFEGVDINIDLPEFPEDCGAILLGAEITKIIPTGDGETKEVLLPYYGSHAVLYNTKLLKEKGFLEIAYRLAALVDLSDQGFCYESLLHLALEKSELKLLCLDKMLFGTIGGISDRTGKEMMPRLQSGKEGLISDSKWEDLLKILRNKKVAILVPKCNVGDGLIYQGTRMLLNRHGIEHEFYPIETMIPSEDCDIYCWAGGGGVSGRWKHNELFSKIGKFLKAANKPFIVMPQSIEEYGDHLNLASLLIVREKKSFEIAKGNHPNLLLMPDLALAIPKLTSPEPTKGAGKYIRKDIESYFVDIENDLGDPVFICPTPNDYLKLASQHTEIETDRLHFAIAGLIYGRKITLIKCAYHKNESMYDTWLKDLGVTLQEEPLKK